jgi:uridine phosphorylase
LSERPPASFPNFAGKHDHDALFSPEQALYGISPLGDDPMPESIVLFYSRALAHYLDERPDTRRAELVGITYPRPAMYLTDDGAIGAVGGFGVGSPAAAMVLETLIATGCTRAINIGMAGGLQTDLPPGSIVVGTSAIRDEGTSHHYLASDAPVEPSAALTDRLTAELDSRGLPYRRGATWTIDAVFRETIAETKHYRDLGVLTVEMEASAVYAVGAVRGVHVTGAFVVADVLHEDGWKPEGIGAAETRARLEQLLEASFAALR